MLTTEDQAIQITRRAALALNLGSVESIAREADAMTPEERAATHKLVEAILERAIELAIVAPRRFVDLRQI